MQVKNIKQASQKGRFLMKPKPKLAALLEIVNSLPKRLGFIRDRETLEVALKGTSDDFRRYISPQGLNADHDVQESLKRLHEAGRWRDALDGFEFLPHLDKRVPYHYGQIAFAIYCDEHGFLQLQENLFTEAIKEGINATRLGRCANENCQRIFWKGRTDQKGCSPACGKVLRTRKWREKSADYEFNRYDKQKKDK